MLYILLMKTRKQEESLGSVQGHTNSKEHTYKEKKKSIKKILSVFYPLHLTGRKSEKQMLPEFSLEESCFFRVMWHCAHKEAGGKGI